MKTLPRLCLIPLLLLCLSLLDRSSGYGMVKTLKIQARMTTWVDPALMCTLFASDKVNGIGVSQSDVKEIKLSKIRRK